MAVKIIIHGNQSINVNCSVFDDWTLQKNGFISPEGKVYTPGIIQLVEWQAGFYLRGKRDCMPERIKRMDEEKSRVKLLFDV